VSKRWYFINYDLHEKALQLLNNDSKKIVKLMEVQLNNLSLPKCPLYEEVLDTLIFGFSCKIDFAVQMGLITKSKGTKLLHDLEKKLSALYSNF